MLVRFRRSCSTSRSCSAALLSEPSPRAPSVLPSLVLFLGVSCCRTILTKSLHDERSGIKQRGDGRSKAVMSLSRERPVRPWALLHFCCSQSAAAALACGDSGAIGSLHASAKARLKSVLALRPVPRKGDGPAVRKIASLRDGFSATQPLEPLSCFSNAPFLSSLCFSVDAEETFRDVGLLADAAPRLLPQISQGNPCESSGRAYNLSTN